MLRRSHGPQVGLVALAIIASLAGCNSSSGVDTSEGPEPGTTTPSTTATTTPAASPSASALPEAEAILSQYRKFFASLTPLSKEPYAVRYPAMQKLAVDPELTTAMSGIAASQALGEVGYGSATVRPKITSIKGVVAALTDCQDNSTVGRQKKASGKKVTVGRANQLAKVAMKRGADGIWRVATVEYAPEGSCHAAA